MKGYFIFMVPFFIEVFIKLYNGDTSYTFIDIINSHSFILFISLVIFFFIYKILNEKDLNKKLEKLDKLKKELKENSNENKK